MFDDYNNAFGFHNFWQMSKYIFIKQRFKPSELSTIITYVD